MHKSNVYTSCSRTRYTAGVLLVSLSSYIYAGVGIAIHTDRPKLAPAPTLWCSFHLCLPNPLDGLCDANIVCLEFVQTDSYKDGGSVQAPHEQLAGLGVSAVGNVVDEDALEAGVGMNNEGGAKRGVENGVDGAGDEGGEGQWY